MNLRYSAWAMLMLAAGSLMAAAPARADARQDVMAGAQRCANIADDRTWLDCFYGSAQPMRARLGLPAAPANQQRLVPPGGTQLYGAPAYTAPTYVAPSYAPVYAAPSYAPAAPVYAAPSYAPAAPVYGAPSYTPAAPIYAAPSPIYQSPTYQAPQAPAAAAAPAGPPPLPRRRDSGFFGTVFGSGKPVISNVRLMSWTTNANGKFVVTLADGEIWEQEPGDDGHPAWREPASRHVVNVYEGALGTYNLSVSDDSQIYKVHRVN